MWYFILKKKNYEICRFKNKYLYLQRPKEDNLYIMQIKITLLSKERNYNYVASMKNHAVHRGHVVL